MLNCVPSSCASLIHHPSIRYYNTQTQHRSPTNKTANTLSNPTCTPIPAREHERLRYTRATHLYTPRIPTSRQDGKPSSPPPSHVSQHTDAPQMLTRSQTRLTLTPFEALPPYSISTTFHNCISQKCIKKGINKSLKISIDMKKHVAYVKCAKCGSRYGMFITGKFSSNLW